jgi:hypothetical protein
MKKAPERMSRGRNSEYQFRRIYPTVSDKSSGKKTGLVIRTMRAGPGRYRAY